MSNTAGTKQDRMHLRLDARTKRKLERAAAYADSSLSAFVLASAVAAADRVIETHETEALSAADWDAFHDALLDPPAPNAALRKAARRYRERAGG